MTGSFELAAADRYCRFLAEHHYENFSVASRLLPRHVRIHLARIYAYCRTTDDFGDESDGDGLRRLEVWRTQVEDCLAGREEPIHPVLIALRETVQRFEMPVRPFLDLIAANIEDQCVKSYEDWQALTRYCTFSAAPVGRMVLAVFGVRAVEAPSLSDDVCIGLQLANFAQDVLVDREKERTYIPQCEIREHGMAGAVEVTCRRASDLLASGEELERLVPYALRAQLALYRLGGLAIVAAVRDVGYQTGMTRPTVGRRTKLRILSQALLGSARRQTAAFRHAA
ncbi:MAG TPA: squalene/phytoene synthase family protein [Chloroflexota bacterium]|nr:squalene/phytoene synthase family protein [Chloroflexota bacterium]